MIIDEFFFLEFSILSLKQGKFFHNKKILIEFLLFFREIFLHFRLEYSQFFYIQKNLFISKERHWNDCIFRDVKNISLKFSIELF